MTKHKAWILGAVAVAIAGSAFADSITNLPVRYGLDVRVRQEYFDNIPIKADPPGVTRGGENDYFRFRTRVWSEYDLMDNVTIRGRLANEFRLWETPDMDSAPQRSNYEFPDEWVIDTLYIDIRDLMDKKLDVRIGRQDLIYGTGKVILEGTPGDGSRTIYFNAAKATWKGIEDSTLDVFGIYGPQEDDLAINSADRPLSIFPKAQDDVDENGAGVYFKNRSIKALPFEAYAIYKMESDWRQAGSTNSAGAWKPGPFAWQSLDEQSGQIVNPQLDLGTFGVRAMPVFSDALSGNIELAWQVGSRDDVDVHGYMVDGFLTFKPPFLADMKPTLDYGVYVLSGDDPASEDDEGWNPLWARYPQFSELYVFAWDAEPSAGRYSNLFMPKAQFTCAPAKWLKTTAMAGYMRAMEDDGPGEGLERGWLGVLKGEFTLGEKLLCARDKLTGHLWLEVLEPGDYYNVDETAVFARWEFMYAF